MKKLQEEDQQLIISEWEKSGQSQTAWCKAQGLNRRTFGNWLKKYRGTGSTPESGFISLPPIATSENVYKLYYPTGVCLECPVNTPLAQLSALLQLTEDV